MHRPSALARGERRRHLVAGLLGAWAVAVVLPLCWTVPAAISIGSAVQALQSETPMLASGWTGVIVHRSPSVGSAGVKAWEWSAGPDSTIQVKGGTAVVDLLLRPAPCPDGRPQTVTVTGTDVVGNVDYVLPHPFAWYRIRLTPVARPSLLMLTYGCTTASTTGKPATAVAVAGIRLQPG